MSSINNKEHGELEQSMWRRFQDAEAKPDPDVWSRIDHALVLQENARYKKRALFYRQLAAACFVLFVLAGSALLLHYKHDEEQALLATTTTQNNKATLAAGNTVPGNKSKDGSTIASQSSAQNTSSALSETATIAQATTGDNHSASFGKTANTVQSSNYSFRSSGAGTTAANTISPTEEAEELLAAATGRTDAANGLGVTGEQAHAVFVPASQAITNVPDSYSSQQTINPLLRRNATLGSFSAEDKATETIAVQKQTEIALALNNPSAPEKEEASIKASKWNVGMGYGSSYFNQNIAIPDYTITPRFTGFGFDADPDPAHKGAPAGPSISVESEENMVAARTEFRENTQAATSFNVDAKAGFRIGKRLKLLAGIGFSQNTSKTKTSYIVEQFIFKPRTNERYKLQPTTVFLPSLNTFTTDSVSVVKTKEPFDVDYSYQMLSVPVGLQVEGNMGQKWFWYASGSVAANFLMQTTIKSSLPEIASVTYSATDDSPFRKIQFSGNIGAGVGKRLYDNINITIGPEFRSYFNSMLTDDKAVATQGRPYTLGLNMGINYTLGANH